VAKLVHYSTEYPPGHGSQTLTSGPRPGYPPQLSKDVHLKVRAKRKKTFLANQGFPCRSQNPRLFVLSLFSRLRVKNWNWNWNNQKRIAIPVFIKELEKSHTEKIQGQTRAVRGSDLWKGLRRRSAKGQIRAGRGRVLGRICEEGC